MVANRKKLREQVAAGDFAAEERQGKQRKKKLEKRKVKKMKEKKVTEMEKQPAAENALSLEERKAAKRLKREERKKRKLEENAGGAIDSNAEAPQAKKRKHDEQDVQEEPMVLSIRGDDGEAREDDEAKEPSHNGSVQKKKKSRRNAKKVDRWGAPVAEDAAPTADADAEDGREKSEQAVEYDPKKVYVGGLPYTVEEDEIYNYFSECGAIEEIYYATFPDTGRFRGLAFVTFKTETGANKALELDGADMNGRFLRIMRSKLQQKPVYAEPAAKTEGCKTAYIGNLSWNLTEEDLRKFFKSCNIKEVRLAKDKETERFKGYGHIDFEDDESLEKAVKLDQKPLLGRPIKVAYAVPPKKSSRTEAEAENEKSEPRKKSGCFTCGEEGHKSFHCPMKA